MARFGCHNRHRLHAGPQGRDRLQAGACRSIVGCRRERKGGFGCMKARRSGIACMGKCRAGGCRQPRTETASSTWGTQRRTRLRAAGRQGYQAQAGRGGRDASCRARAASGVDSRAQTNGPPAATSLPAHYAHEQADEGHDASSGNLRRGAGGVASSSATLAAGAT